MITFEKVLDALYENCRDRTLTSKQVFDKMVKKLDIIGTERVQEKAIEIIKPYKQTFKDLEKTSRELYNLLNNINKIDSEDGVKTNIGFEFNDDLGD